MNVTVLHCNPETDYRAAMQQAAVAFLLRHRGEHLTVDDQVLDNCARYLSQSLEVPPQLVPRIAELAVAEFEGLTTKRLAILGVHPAVACSGRCSGCSTPEPSNVIRSRRASCPHGY